MLSEHKISKGQVTTFTADAEISELQVGNSRFGIGVILIMAGFVGAWGFVCLINGIAQTQSIQELGRGIFTAFTGI